MGPEVGDPEIACQSQLGGVITSGGGFSTFKPTPSWQKAAVKSYFQTLPYREYPTDGYNPKGRAYPDVSLIGVWYEVFIQGELTPIFGTSASAPVFAAMISLVNAERASNGKRSLGFINPMIYSYGAHNPYFNDVYYEGNNKCMAYGNVSNPSGATCCESGFYTNYGWDPVTGYGSIQYSNIESMIEDAVFMFGDDDGFADDDFIVHLTDNPTTDPTADPTVEPTAGPTAGPTVDPTASPTAIVCPPGSFNTNDVQCTACPAGTYSSLAGSTVCVACNVGFYSTGNAEQCTICPSNRVTAGAGATSDADCLNPVANFVQGVLAFVAAFAISVIYIMYGRMNAVAFGRKRHVQEAGKSYVALTAAILRVPLTAKPEKPTDYIKYAKILAFVSIGVVAFVGTAFALSLMIFGQIFFTAMIIWRNVRFSISISFIERVHETIGQLDNIVGAVVPIQLMFGWIFFFVETLASFNIDLGAVEVTCVGSQAPIQLLINFLLFVFIVLLIECDVAAFLATSFYRTHKEYRSVVVNAKARHTVDYPPREKLRRWLISSAETSLFSSRLVVYVLQYAVSFIALQPFFAHNGRHASTTGCDKISGVRYIDTTLAVGSSVILYCMLPPLLYNVAKLLVPRLLKKDKHVAHTALVESVRDQRVTLRYSFVPSVDYFVSWRFKWAYNVLYTRKHNSNDELMFLRKEDPPVDPPNGIGICPLVSTLNEEFQYEWENECQERLPPYGLFFTGAFKCYFGITLKNFWTFFNVMLGKWNANSMRKFNIINTLIYNGFDLAPYLEKPEYESSSKTPLQESLAKLAHRCWLFCRGDMVHEAEFSPEDGGESRVQVGALLAAELSTRATLFMLIPFGSLITTYVSMTSANPIFCGQAKKLSKLLPGLLMFDAYQLAEKRVLQMGAYAQWKIRLMSACIFVTESRLLKYLFNLLCYIMAMSVTFFPDTGFLAFGVCVILVYSMFAALHPVVVISNIFEIDNDDKEEASADGKRKHKADPSHRRSSILARPSTRSAGGLGSSYNFYIDSDEEEDDKDEKDKGAAFQKKDHSVSAGVELGSIRRLGANGGVVMVGEVSLSPMTEPVNLAEHGELPSATAAPR
jgi:hypothetical protein